MLRRVSSAASCNSGGGGEFLRDGKRTIRTSRRVSLVSQSLFSVSTHTLPDTSSTLGCQIRVLKAALGGVLG
jgi:hypothetical protein